MPIIVSVPKETVPGEQRVVRVPELVPRLPGAGLGGAVQSGAGELAGFFDDGYAAKDARLEAEVRDKADIILKVQPPMIEEISHMKEDSVLICFLQPYTNAAAIRALAARQITAFSMELMPRITRAQPMDALSAMSTVAGYKAVLVAASRLPRFFPLLMTAAGTVTPARVFVIAAGQGGNCALTEPGREIVRHGVVIIGPMNLPSTIPFQASEMYARTVTNYLAHLLKDGGLHLDLEDELTRGPLVTHRGEVVHEIVKARLCSENSTP